MKFDHIIIGAGVIGSATAFHLKRLDAGSNILLIDERSRPGAGNTAKSAALYRNIFSSDVSRKLAVSSIHYYEELGEKIQLDPIGYLWLFSEEQWKRSAGARNRLDPDKDRLSFLERSEVSSMLNVNLEGAGRFPDIHRGIHGRMCGSLSGMGLAEHYTERFRELGGKVLLNTRIMKTGLTGSTSGYAPWDDVQIQAVVDDNGKEYQADHFIAATGAWTHQFLTPLGIAPNVYPKKRQLFGLKITDRNLFSRIPSSDKVPAVIFPAGGVYIKPVLDRKFIMVGCAEGMGQPFDMSDPEPYEEYFRQAIEPVLEHYLPHLKGYRLMTKWAGYYSYHWPDKNPVVESVSNLSWVSGTSGSGIMKADAIGRVAAGHSLGMKQVELADGIKFEVGKLSLWNRDVENEEFII